VDRFSSSERRFEHPQVGTLLLEHHQLTPADAPGLQLVVYTAAEGGDAATGWRACRPEPVWEHVRTWARRACG
jgi:hypothetical protein